MSQTDTSNQFNAPFQPNFSPQLPTGMSIGQQGLIVSVPQIMKAGFTAQFGPTSSQPVNPTLGQLYVNTTIPAVQYWNGTSWVNLGGGGGGGGILTINGDGTPAQLIVGGSNISVATVTGTTTVSFSGLLPIASGGTGTATPGDTAGPGIFITGAFPNETIGAWPELVGSYTPPQYGGSITVQVTPNNSMLTLRQEIQVPSTDSSSNFKGIITAFPDSTHVTLYVPPPTLGGGGFSPSTYDQMAQAEPGLTYYWPLSDASGAAVETQQGFNGTATGSPGYHAASLIAGGDFAMSFGSTGNYLTTASNIVNANNSTFLLWMKLPSLPGAASYVFCTDTGTTKGYQYYISTTGHIHIVNSDIGDNDSGYVVSAGATYCLGFNYDSGIHRLYVNGALQYTLYQAGITSLANTNKTGISTNNLTNGGQGIVMQKLMWFSETTLSSQRMLAYYNAGNSGSYSYAF